MVLDTETRRRLRPLRDGGLVLPGMHSARDADVVLGEGEFAVLDAEGGAVLDAAERVVQFSSEAGYVLLSATESDLTFQIVGGLYLERSIPARGVGVCVCPAQVVLGRDAVARLAAWAGRHDVVRIRIGRHGCFGSVPTGDAAEAASLPGAVFDRRELLIKAADAVPGSLRFVIEGDRCSIAGGEGALVASVNRADAAVVEVPARAVVDAVQAGFGPDLLITIAPGPSLVIRFAVADGLTIALAGSSEAGSLDAGNTFSPLSADQAAG